MDLYAENILDHYRHPRNKGQGPALRPFGKAQDKLHSGQVARGQDVITHTEENLSCGDTVTIHLSIKDDRITEISWDGTGCAISQAAMSLLSEELIGKKLDDVESLTPKAVYDILGVPIGPRRVKCALLGLHTLKNALQKQRGEEMQSWTGMVGTR